MQEDNLITKSISFHIPIEILSKSGDDERWIQGIASTADMDLQNERVFQDGIDYSYLMSDGYFNDDHKDGVEYLVGEPRFVEITAQGLFVKGVLYKDKPRADYWWNHLQTLELNKSNRKVGMSIQGKIQSKSGNDVYKCWLTAIAITANPVNTSTWANIIKSLNQSYSNKENYVQEAIIPTSDITDLGKGMDKIGFDEAVSVLQLTNGWSRNLAERIVKAHLVTRK